MKQVSTGRAARRVTLNTVVYIPELDGYWVEALPILKLCINSLCRNSGEDCDVAVFDNGSCAAVRDYLLACRTEGRIQYLVLSDDNVGKLAAQDYLLHAAQGTYVAYTDSDVLFYPGWLQKSIRCLDTFPRVGMVSGLPWRPMGAEDEALARDNAMRLRAAEAVAVEEGDLVSHDALQGHADSLGIAMPEARVPDVRVRKDGVTAYGFGSHFQFVTTREVIHEVGRLGATATGDGKGVRAWDNRLDSLQYVRLALETPHVRHLGNSLEGEDVSEFEAIAGAGIAGRKVASVPRLSRLTQFCGGVMKIPLCRRALTRLQQAIYEALHLARRSGGQ